MTKHEEMLTQVSNTKLMFNMSHGGRQNAANGLNNNSSNFHITGLPPSCEHGDSIGQTKDVMVYARGINHV